MQRPLHLRSQPKPRVKKETRAMSSTLAYADIVNEGALADSNGFNGVPAQGATLKNLCEEDKQKVARLIRQVVSVTKEKEAVQREAAQERASQQAALEGLQAQNRDLLAELTALRLKLLHADGLLRSYQLKLRALKVGASREVALALDSPTPGQPAQAAAAALPRSTSPNSLNAPGVTSSASLGAHLTPATPPEAEPSRGGGLPASPSKPALDRGHSPPATSAAPAISGVLEATRASSEQRRDSPPSGAADAPAEGVWAAWAELEQRIRAISGELAQRGGQHGGDAAGADVGVGGGKPQGGNAAGGMAFEDAPTMPVSFAPGHDSEVCQRPMEGMAVSASADVLLAAVACFQGEPDGKPSKQTGTGFLVPNPPGSVLAVDPSGAREPPLGSQTEAVCMSSAHQPLVGGPVSQPRPVFFPPKEAPLRLPPSYPPHGAAVPDAPPQPVLPTVGVLQGRLPPVDVSSPAIAGPAPVPAASLPAASTTAEGSAVQALWGTALPSCGCPPSTCAAASAPLLKSGHPIGAPDGCQRVHLGAVPMNGTSDVSRSSGGAAVAAEVRCGAAGSDQVRELQGARLDAQAGPAGVGRATDVSGIPDRGEAPCERVLRFDPTVGDAGAFYYVDVAVVEKSRADGAGDGMGGETGGQRRRPGERSEGAEDVSRRAREESPLGGPGQDGRRRATRGAEVEGPAPSSLLQKAVAEGVPGAEVPLALATAAPRVAQRVVVKESGVRHWSVSPEGSPSRGGGQGRARWVSGMLYDSALLELVEELEMDHARTSRHDPRGDLPAELTAWARQTDRQEAERKWRGAPQPVSSVNGRGKVQARGKRDRHPTFVQSQLEPEVLVLTNGW
ncbi:hypothetical protein KFL_007530040 [Klebsormidium nitens]|uniref:Uncharacterized protein n=1 Tax=Klebsormidium nitens TaxID=105231 RepID=A0A1Y1IR69_KLENI|nr:hypothetical protein KFL_007530040 [Klebsormidium nitens]|eukprot:GAQ91256.1 hypothetical protein KFL_007530040 [Klebsormidium nitens]